MIFSYITFVYFGAFVFYLFMMVMGRSGPGRVATFILWMGFVAHTFAILLRWFESYQMGIGHAPLSDLYESLVFFSWAIVLLYVLVEWRTKNRSFGTFVTPLAFLAMAYASFSPGIESQIRPLLPALKSNWLISHVVTCFFGYAAFGIAFGVSLMYLIKRLDKGGRERSLLTLIPATGILDDLNHQMMVIGFIMLTLGIITGSVWAQSAWGRYWGWDPKETASLITWLVYASALHSRLIVGWRGKKTAILCIIGFFCVLMTYFGVNFLTGLHSYAK
ncbi:MAG: c-type cytochrome biogenesis protein CcsB [Thermodesulfobacteriota bacterium]|jgi:cytochrome c-type biogenesis protein CcsB|nr:c-type cytochrome biogenesis protein CcsB [Thermodesulfobacteriota bacterium]